MGDLAPWAAGGEALEPGRPVEVRNRLDGRWSGGFEIQAVTADGYRLRRLSDGSVLPVALSPEDVRPFVD